MKGRVMVGAAVAGLLLLAMVGLFSGAPSTVEAAPAAAPTPVSVTRPANGTFIVFDLFNGDVLDEDTTSECVDIGGYSLADVQYTIDQTDVNTVTLTTQWSVDGGTLVSGVNVVASNAADATDMQQVALFGRYFCVLANVTNTSDVTVTVKAIAK